MSKYQKVMVIEDDFDIRETLVSVLELEGFEVIEAQHGQDALKLLLQMTPENYPGLILLDLMMPVMDGQAFLNKINADHKHLLAIPIVLASANLRNISEEIRSTVVEVLRKPLNIDDLYDLVRKYCKAL